MLELSAAEARLLALDGIGLRTKFQTVEQVIDRLGLLQIDSVNVFERAHFMPLFSRLGSYDKQVLETLQTSQNGQPPKLIEYWAHEASLIPIENLPYYKHRMDGFRNGDKKANWASWYANSENKKLVAWLMNEIESRGPLTVKQIEHDQNKRTGNWWGWSPVKTALEYLFFIGDLTSAGRDNFSRRYALPEQVLPPAIIKRLHEQDHDEARRWLLMHGADTLAIGTAKDIVDYHRMKYSTGKLPIQELVDSGDFIEAKVEGWQETAYLTKNSIKLLNAASPNGTNPTTILSPFDPLVWYRERAIRIFDFDYKIEIYTPKEKRIYGYYTLPVLHNRKLVGRIDLKSNRQTKTLEVKSAWAETWLDEKQLKSAGAALTKTLRDAMQWQKLDRISNEKVGTLSDYLEL